MQSCPHQRIPWPNPRSESSHLMGLASGINHSCCCLLMTLGKGKAQVCSAVPAARPEIQEVDRMCYGSYACTGGVLGR